jgi:nucleoside-diphosphate-sugar epimerase
LKVLVTGATGFIGRFVVQAVEKSNISYIAIGQRYTTTQRNRKNLCLLDKYAVTEFFRDVKPSHLIHLAWFTDHNTYRSSPINLIWKRATIHLVNEFYRNGGEYALITGTCAEYRSTEDYCKERQTALEPETLYGVAKNDTRKIVEGICRAYGARLTWARIFYPYGSGDRPSRLIPGLFDVFKGNRAPFGIHSEYKRDFIHVSDVASAIMTCVKEQYNDSVNISSGEGTTLKEVVTQVASFFGKKPCSILDIKPSAKPEALVTVGDNTRLLNLGWKQTISLTAGLRDYI